MTKITVERNSIKHDAIQALGFVQQIGSKMVGMKDVSKNPKWVRSSWNGYQFEQFEIYLTDDAINAVNAYAEKYKNY